MDIELILIVLGVILVSMTLHEAMHGIVARAVGARPFYGVGPGFAYTSFPFTKSEEFSNYEREARAQNRGLWNACQPTQNDYGGYTSNDER